MWLEFQTKVRIKPRKTQDRHSVNQSLNHVIPKASCGYLSLLSIEREKKRRKIPFAVPLAEVIFQESFF